MGEMMISVLSDLNSGKKPFFLAPLAELTHLPFRMLVDEFGGCDYFFTEMISAGALTANTPYESFYSEAGKLADRTVFQLAGSDPDAICAAAERLMRLPGAGIDINMGCSAYTIVRKGWGICWMEDPRRAGSLIAALRPIVKGRSLSVKMRIGWTADEGAFREFASALEEGGVDFITLNPQTKKDNRNRTGDWRWVTLLKETVSVPVVGNGNITDAESFLFRAGGGARSGSGATGSGGAAGGFGADGYMIGRGAVARPWLFRQLSKLGTEHAEPETVDLYAVLMRFRELFCLYQPPEFLSSRLSRFLFYFCGNLRFGSRVFSEARNCGRNADAMTETVTAYLERHPEERFLRI